MGIRDRRHISVHGRLVVLGLLSMLSAAAWSRESLCGANLSSDDEVEKVAIAARPVSEAALASFRNADIPLRPEIQADLGGLLTRQQLEARDPRKQLLLEFDEVSNLTRHTPK
ncbi:hypothetical protein [Solilutibacter silvestris]|uniref:Uncharacterized protein n=1 Tax=Solilutibacter silvestris TaxID=1645665 RepID=A0A2K1Q168_9GAMM|nr:hypothetical protein [Lysobacter silvestris]PNS08783.1 hypothetical protein Lysil_0412 [Lysobacter silvestris]